MGAITSIPNIIGGTITGFIAILLITQFYPIFDTILGLFQTGSLMKVVGTIGMWLVFYMIIWHMVWLKYFAQHVERFSNK